MKIKCRIVKWIAGVFVVSVGFQSATAANVMCYGSGGADFYFFSGNSMAFAKASGFTTLIPFAMHVDAGGTLWLGGSPVCSNGVYTGPSNWSNLVATVKTPPTTVTRYEVCIGGWTDASFDNIRSLVTAQGVGPTSILYKNFQALKTAVPGIDAINDDDEQTYHLGSRTNFANMLGGLGYKYSLVPYTAQSFWVNLKKSITNCDAIYLQCYAGGAGNSPSQWNTAFGNGVKVIPGQESNTSSESTWRNWYLQTGTQGGFYFPDVVFSSTYWSALIYQANGVVPAAPTGVTGASGTAQVSLSWNTVPGAISYNIKRSTVSGGEVTVKNVSTLNNGWPNSNQYFDTSPVGGVTNYYQICGVNAYGEGLPSTELIAIPQAASVFNFDLPDIGAGNHAYSPSGGPWTFNGTLGNGSGLVANGSAFGNPNAPGTNMQGGFIQGYGTIFRSLSGFAPGTNYTITFLAAERSGNSQTWNVKIDNNVIGSFNPGSSATSYSNYTAIFFATATSHSLQFVGTDLPGGDNTLFINDVRISPPLLVGQTGEILLTMSSEIGSGSGTFYPSWTVQTNGSLIAGRLPTTATGDFSKEAPGRSVASLTTSNNLGITLVNGTSSTNYVTCGDGFSAGSTLIYTLPSNSWGYDLTNITVYGGWASNGRDQQAYTVYYSTKSAPSTFVKLTVVNYSPTVGNGLQSATRVILTSSSGVLATNVAAVKFDFTNPASENGYCGYGAIAAFGKASLSPPVPMTIGMRLGANNNLVMNLGSLVVGRNYNVLSTTNLTPPIFWNTDSSFTATTTSASITNSISGASQKFYQILGY